MGVGVGPGVGAGCRCRKSNCRASISELLPARRPPPARPPLQHTHAPAGLCSATSRLAAAFSATRGSAFGWGAGAAAEGIAAGAELATGGAAGLAAAATASTAAASFSAGAAVLRAATLFPPRVPAAAANVFAGCSSSAGAAASGGDAALAGTPKLLALLLPLLPASPSSKEKSTAPSDVGWALPPVLRTAPAAASLAAAGFRLVATEGFGVEEGVPLLGRGLPLPPSTAMELALAALPTGAAAAAGAEERHISGMSRQCEAGTQVHPPANQPPIGSTRSHPVAPVPLSAGAKWNTSSSPDRSTTARTPSSSTTHCNHHPDRQQCHTLNTCMRACRSARAAQPLPTQQQQPAHLVGGCRRRGLQLWLWLRCILHHHLHRSHSFDDMNGRNYHWRRRRRRCLLHRGLPSAASTADRTVASQPDPNNLIINALALPSLTSEIALSTAPPSLPSCGSASPAAVAASRSCWCSARKAARSSGLSVSRRVLSCSRKRAFSARNAAAAAASSSPPPLLARIDCDSAVRCG